MEIILGLKKFHKNRYKKPFVLTIGNFDGVHLAHQKIIKTTIRRAKFLNGTSIIVTFFPHPLKILQPEKKIALLTDNDHKLELIAKLKPDLCLVIKFQKLFAKIKPEKFLKEIIKHVLSPAEIVVGRKFNFGENKSGDINYLKKIGEFIGYKVKIVPPLIRGDAVISSTLIRQIVAFGDLYRASLMLGWEFSITGIVKSADKRGRALGFPTANIDSSQEALPPTGVYAARIKLANRFYHGMLNIGTRPTFYPQADNVCIEVNIFNFKRDIYGQRIKIIPIQKLRKEKKFSSSSLLQKQLRRDKKSAEVILREYSQTQLVCSQSFTTQNIQ